MPKGIQISPSNYPREDWQVKSDQQDVAVEKLEKNGMEVCEYSKGNTQYQYILDPRDTRKGAGLFLWKLIDFLVQHRDYVLLRKADFMGKVSEAKTIQKFR
ncbi:MAG: hypothetical protein DRJ03_23665 [Chloroflexi bacterium]|nr:MAG: hypothetical protein DRJ03_23665 [Chloroflexota bacterium]